MIELTQANFEQEVVKSDKPVLVDFWAEWCGPCKAIAPVLDEIAAEHAGKLKIGKVNVDHHQAIAGKYGIRAIPTLLVFTNGEVREQIVGNMSKKDLLKKLSPYIA